MSESFKKLKKKFLCAAIIKSALAGIFCALLAVGAVLIVLKRNAVALDALYYVLIGAGAAAVAFGVTFLLVRPTDKKVAKRLDADYALHEKVQTMVEFQKEESDMVRLQRENTSEILKTVPRKRPSFKRLWQYALIAVLSCAVFVTSVVIPAVEKEKIPPTDGYEITDWQEKALMQLIEEVKTSDLEDAVRTPSVATLEGLLSDLKNTDTGAAMRSKVIEGVQAIDDTVAAANSYRDIVTVLAKNEELKDLSSSLLNAAASYKDDKKIDEIEEVRTRAAVSDEKITAALTEYSTEFMARFEEVTELAACKPLLESFLSSFNETMLNVAPMPEDKLYIALSELSVSLGKIIEELDYYSEVASFTNRTASIFDSYVSASSVALEPQVYNCMMDEFIRNRLSGIFGIPVSMFPATDLVLPGGSQSGADSDGDKNDPSNSGGYGEGEIKYGSDDLIYNPAESEHVQYGTVLDKYIASYLNYLNDKDTSAQISETMKNYLTQYFNALNGNKADEESEEDE